MLVKAQAFKREKRIKSEKAAIQDQLPAEEEYVHRVDPRKGVGLAVNFSTNRLGIDSNWPRLLRFASPNIMSLGGPSADSGHHMAHPGLSDQGLCTGHSKVGEFEIRRIPDFSLRLHTSFIRLHQNTGDTSANCRIKWGVTIIPLADWLFWCVMSNV